MSSIVSVIISLSPSKYTLMRATNFIQASEDGRGNMSQFNGINGAESIISNRMVRKGLRNNCSIMTWLEWGKRLCRIYKMAAMKQEIQILRRNSLMGQQNGPRGSSCVLPPRPLVEWSWTRFTQNLFLVWLLCLTAAEYFMGGLL